jgi:hypothetical protein
MARVGDDIAGFSIDAEGDSTLRVVGRGFWNLEVALAFYPHVRAALIARPGLSHIIFDFSALKPLRDQGQEGFLQVLGAIRAMSQPRVSVLTSSPLTKLQLLRIVKESGNSEWVDLE